MTKPSIHQLHKQNYQFEPHHNIFLVQQYNKQTKEWKVMGYRCSMCDVSLKSVISASKHHTSCKQLNTTKKRKTFVPIQVITQNGKRMYRYGDTGKLYPNRADAEKQAAAIMASGYKEKKDMDKK